MPVPPLSEFFQRDYSSGARRLAASPMGGNQPSDRHFAYDAPMWPDIRSNRSPVSRQRFHPSRCLHIPSINRLRRDGLETALPADPCKTANTKARQAMASLPKQIDAQANPRLWSSRRSLSAHEAPFTSRLMAKLFPRAVHARRRSVRQVCPFIHLPPRKISFSQSRAYRRGNASNGVSCFADLKYLNLAVRQFFRYALRGGMGIVRDKAIKAIVRRIAVNGCLEEFCAFRQQKDFLRLADNDPIALTPLGGI